MVSPRLELTTSQATHNHHWIPIIPCTDLALVMGMLSWIIEQNRFNADYLSRPNLMAAQATNYASYCNASYLIIVEPNHPKYGQILRISDLQVTQIDPEDKIEENYMVVKDCFSGQLVCTKDCSQADIFVQQQVTLLDGSSVQVASSMSLLKQQCEEKNLEEYADICKVPVETIKKLAEEFVSHGTKSVAIIHGGSIHSTGFYTSWAILLLNSMVGNMNKKGGMCINAGKFKDFGDG